MQCFDCGKETEEFLVWERIDGPWWAKFFGPASKPLCREHLIQRFRECFLAQIGQKAVIFHPNLEEKHGNYQYVYTPVPDLQRAARTDSVAQQVLEQTERWLAAIHGPCAKCSFRGEVAYFDRSKVEWKPMRGFLGRHFDYPAVHEVTAAPEVLCRKCAFEFMEESLRSTEMGFEDGVICPSPEYEGIYITIEV